MSVSFCENAILEPSKLAIATAFGKAAKDYDKHAAFQRDVADRLAQLLPDELTGKRVLDVGCGTGYLSQLLVERGAVVTCSDISESMLQQAQLRLGNRANDFSIQDAEALTFDDQTFDLVVSSLALQWCTELSLPLKEMSRVTKQNGKVFFSTLLDGSLFELANAWSKIDSYQHINRFNTQDEVKIALAQSQNCNYSLDLPEIIVWYEKALNLMQDLKGIGATHVSGRSNGLTNRRALTGVEQEYQKFRDSQGRIPATYKVCLGTINR